MNHVLCRESKTEWCHAQRHIFCTLIRPDQDKVLTWYHRTRRSGSGLLKKPPISAPTKGRPAIPMERIIGIDTWRWSHPAALSPVHTAPGIGRCGGTHRHEKSWLYFRPVPHQISGSQQRKPSTEQMIVPFERILEPDLLKWPGAEEREKEWISGVQWMSWRE